MSTMKIQERVNVKAPLERVWRFLIDPERVVTCLPGAGYDGKEGDNVFLGHMKVKVGPVVTQFKGKATMETVDEAQHSVRIVGEGKDQAGQGSARLVMNGRVAQVDGGVELVVEADVDLVGRLVTFGRGMIQAVSAQLFKEFSERARAVLEAEPPPVPADTGGALVPAPPPALPSSQEPLRALPLIFRAFWSSIRKFFRRLFRRG